MSASRIDEQDVRRVAKAARIKLTAKEESRLAVELSNLFAAFETLRHVDTNGVEATAHGTLIRNVTRSDDVRPSLPREQTLANAPETSEGYFKVPRVLEEE